VDVSPPQGGTVKIDETIPTTYPITTTVANSKSVILEAIPADGYEFAGWSGSLTGQDNPATLVMSCAKSVTASFSEKERLSLTVEVKGAGSVIPSAGTHSYTQGTVVSINATPNAGYRFDGWTGEVGDASSANTTVTMDSAKTVIANFSQITHTLTIEVKGAGSVTPSPGDHTCIEGSWINIIATPDTGYQFDSWTGDVGDASSANTTVTVDSDKTVIANFSETKPNWLPIGAIIAGGILVAGGVIWLAARRRRTRA
jgi:uncharacterized repeat protein (TIGR02543 family)